MQCGNNRNIYRKRLKTKNKFLKNDFEINPMFVYQ